MRLPLNTWLNGLSALSALLVAFIHTIIFLVRYIKTKKKLIPLVAFVGLCMGTFYSGPVLSFFSLLIKNQNLNSEVYFFLSYTLLPISMVAIMFLSFNIFKPDYQKHMVVFYSILCIIAWVAIFGWHEKMYDSTEPTEGQLLDINLTNIFRVISVFYILSVLIVVSGGFFWFRRKLKMNDLPKSNIDHATYLAVGWLLFCIGAVIEALIPASLIAYILIARIIMILSYFSIFRGFLPPKE